MTVCTKLNEEKSLTEDSIILLFLKKTKEQNKKILTHKLQINDSRKLQITFFEKDFLKEIVLSGNNNTTPHQVFLKENNIVSYNQEYVIASIISSCIKEKPWKQENNLIKKELIKINNKILFDSQENTVFLKQNQDNDKTYFLQMCLYNGIQNSGFFANILNGIRGIFNKIDKNFLYFPDTSKFVRLNDNVVQSDYKYGSTIISQNDNKVLYINIEQKDLKNLSKIQIIPSISPFPEFRLINMKIQTKDQNISLKFNEIDRKIKNIEEKLGKNISRHIFGSKIYLLNDVCSFYYKIFKNDTLSYLFAIETILLILFFSPYFLWMLLQFIIKLLNKQIVINDNNGFIIRIFKKILYNWQHASSLLITLAFGPIPSIYLKSVSIQDSFCSIKLIGDSFKFLITPYGHYSGIKILSISIILASFLFVILLDKLNGQNVKGKMIPFFTKILVVSIISYVLNIENAGSTIATVLLFSQQPIVEYVYKQVKK